MTEKAHTFSKFIYLDTNILSELAKKKLPWKPFRNFLIKNDLTIAITGQQLLELEPAHRLHSGLEVLLDEFSSAFIKTWDKILDEEINSHPKYRMQSLYFKTLTIKDVHEIISIIKKDRMNAEQHKYAAQLNSRHQVLKGNFKPKRGNKFTVNDAKIFTSLNVRQQIGSYKHNFLLPYKNDFSRFNISPFKSIKLYAEFIFYKYYLGNREPKELSDFGDLAHLHAIPYCEYAIIEKDNCEILNQIKHNENTLNLTTIKKMKFIRELE